MTDKNGQPDSAKPSYEPRPMQKPVDYQALGKLSLKRFPKIIGYLAALKKSPHNE